MTVLLPKGTVQSTPLNLNRKYAKILFALHDDSNSQVFKFDLNSPFSITFVSRLSDHARQDVLLLKGTVLCCYDMGITFSFSQ